jgi:hypothetical protein
VVSNQQWGSKCNAGYTGHIQEIYWGYKGITISENCGFGMSQNDGLYLWDFNHNQLAYILCSPEPWLESPLATGTASSSDFTWENH